MSKVIKTCYDCIRSETCFIFLDIYKVFQRAEDVEAITDFRKKAGVAIVRSCQGYKFDLEIHEKRKKKLRTLQFGGS